MDPSIFGTLFERVMDPAQRSSSVRITPAFATSRPWLSPLSWPRCGGNGPKLQEKIASLVPDVIVTRKGESLFRPVDEPRIQEAQKLVDAFLDRLRAIRSWTRPADRGTSCTSPCDC